MYDFIRTASVVPDILVADVSYNTAQIINFLQKDELLDTDIIVFPELCITGYTCGDLFFQKTLQKNALNALKEILKHTQSRIVVVGLPVTICGQLYNCAAVLSGGKICGIVPKTFLPVYNEYYEKRWFSSSADLPVDSISSKALLQEDDYTVSVGRDLIFNINNEITFGIEICEDLWTPIPPSCFLSVNGAEIILNLSASNETIAKHTYRRDLVRLQSAGNICAYLYTSSGAAESSTDLIFSGHSIFAENGTIIAENKELTDSNYSIVRDFDIGKIKSDRMKNKSFKDSKTIFAHKESARFIDITLGEIKGDGSKYTVNKQPFVPASKSDRIDRCMEIFKMQVGGLSKRIKTTGCKMVVGVSGGLDSTLALLVAAQTAKRLNMPSTDVFGITMPCFGTSDRTYNNSLALMKALSISREEINIKEAVSQHFKDIGHDGKTLDLTYENSQARERTQVLMDYAGKVGGLVVGTGDLSELALGWCTYNADHMSMYGVNAGIPKTLVKWMIDSIIEYNIFPGATDILKDITDTPISPELLPPDSSGNISQETEDIIGPYELHDFFLYYILRFGFEPSKIYRLAQNAFKGEYTNEFILKWLKNFYKRFFSQQFKRSCLPDGVKIGSVCLSPRGDWRMPSDASVNLWLKEIEKLK
ncbi:MAG: NAD(+) synthase [Clostridia bacterium]|nr:NAD(+) synthase [Clostridia bacterium]